MAAGRTDHEVSSGGPLVAYKRLFPRDVIECAFPPNTNADEATCAFLRDDQSLLLIGTREGRVWSFGCMGKAASGVEEHPVEVCRHGAAVTDVVLDDSGAVSASSAADGSISVGFLPKSCVEVLRFEASPRWTYVYPKAINGIALCPTYASGSTESRAVCLGGEECKLILNRRGAFDSRNLTIHAGEGSIVAVKWRGPLIAWANARGIKVVDIETYQKVTHIPWPSAANSTTAMQCTLAWSSDDVLLIGWGHYVLIAEIRQKPGGPVGVRFARVAHCFCFSTMQIVVRGISAFDAEHVSVLTTMRDDSIDTEFEIATHHICSWSGDVLCSEKIPGTGPSSQLVSACRQELTLVLARRDVFIIRRRGVGDHVDWLIDHAHFEAAVALVSRTSRSANVADMCRICLQCIKPLLSRGEPGRAARIARHLGVSAGAEVAAWTECVRLFDEAGHLLILVPEIPVPSRWSCHDDSVAIQKAASSRLPSSIYDTVLNRLAAVSPAEFCAALDRWPSHIYSAGPLMDSLRTALPVSIVTDLDADGDSTSSPSYGALYEHDFENLRLAEALASLHESQGDCVTAARLLSRVGSGALMPFISRHVVEDEALREYASYNLSRLFASNSQRALELFVNHPETFLPAEVLGALLHRGRHFQYEYLKLLAQKESTAMTESRSLYVELMAELEPHSLVSQFSSGRGISSDISVESISDDAIVEKDARFEDVILVAAMSCGASDAEAAVRARRQEWYRAHELLLQELGDVEGAVRLIEEAPSVIAKELWAVLLKFAASDQRTFSLLLARLACGEAALPIVGASPRSLVQQLPARLEIPRVGTKVTSALDEAEANRDIHWLTMDMVQSATAAQSLKVLKQQRRGRAIAGRAMAGQRLTAQAGRGGAARKVPEQFVSALRAVADGVYENMSNI